MPITSALPIRPISQEEFAQIDFQVMRHAFDSQNELGRLCDEVIYQNDLASRLESAGLSPVRKEVPVTVSHRDFVKTYSLDLVVGDGAIYELKTATGIVERTEGQLFLLELNVTARTIRTTGFSKDQAVEAQDKYLEVEKTNKDKPENQAVLVSVDSLAALPKAYPNYYLDISQFLKVLIKILA